MYKYVCDYFAKLVVNIILFDILAVPSGVSKVRSKVTPLRS